MSYIHPTLGHRAHIHYGSAEYMRPVSIAVNRLSCPWHRKDPREPGHGPQETHLRDLRARVAHLYAHFVAGSVAPATAAVARRLGVIGTGSVGAPRLWARPSLAARTDGSYVASGTFSRARKVLLEAVVRSRSRAPCFCLLTAHRWHVHSTYSTWPLRGWGLVVERILGSQ